MDNNLLGKDYLGNNVYSGDSIVTIQKNGRAVGGSLVTVTVKGRAGNIEVEPYCSGLYTRDLLEKSVKIQNNRPFDDGVVSD